LRQRKIGNVEDVRAVSEYLVAPSAGVQALKDELEIFLHRNVYSHPRVMRMGTKGRRLLGALFAEFCRAPELLPARYGARATAGNRERTVCDYLAGMTDRYAQEEYLRLFQPFHGV
jgi:dGTPase